MERMEEVVKKIAAKLGIVSYTHINGDYNDIGEGNFGTFKIFVICGNKSGEPTTLNVLAKFPPSNEFLRREGPVTWMFAREIFVYEKILPVYNEIDENFTAPACYYTSAQVPNELLVLQDMRYSGYRLYRKSMFFDFDHAEVSIKTLARFHALSAVLKISDSVNYGECVRNCLNFFQLDQSVDLKRRMRHLLRQTSEEIGGEIGNILQDIAQDDADVFVYDPKIQVLRHGDTWKNNILFKYEDDRPVSACLVDFQTAHVGAAASDLVYLIATSSDSLLRRHHFEHLIQTYHDTVEEVLLGRGISSTKVDECFSYCDLKKDMKRVGRECVSIVNHSFRNWLGIDPVVELNSETFVATSSGKVVDEEIRKNFNSIITDLVMDFKTFELI